MVDTFWQTETVSVGCLVPPPQTSIAMTHLSPQTGRGLHVCTFGLVTKPSAAINHVLLRLPTCFYAVRRVQYTVLVMSMKSSLLLLVSNLTALSFQGGHVLTPLPAATPLKPGSAVSDTNDLVLVSSTRCAAMFVALSFSLVGHGVDMVLMGSSRFVLHQNITTWHSPLGYCQETSSDALWKLKWILIVVIVIIPMAHFRHYLFSGSSQPS